MSPKVSPINLLKTTAVLAVLVFCSSGYGQFFFEGGPSFHEFLYVNPYPEKAGTMSDVPLRSRLQQNIADWMEIYRHRGINLFSVFLYSREGIYLCTSSVLKDAGFRHIQDLGDIFPLVLEEAHKRDICLSISLADLAHIVNGTQPCREWLDPAKLTPDKIAAFIQELGDYSRSYKVGIWINEESFGPLHQKAIARACRQNDIKYVRYFGDPDGLSDVFCSEDYATYPVSPDTDPNDARYLYDLARWGSAYGRIGYLNVMFGRARALGKQTGVLTAGGWGLTPGCQQNVALFRAVQFSPSLYCFHAATYAQKPYENTDDRDFVHAFDYRRLLSLLDRYARRPTDQTKPIGNLILDLPDPPFKDEGADIFDNALTSSSEAITNAITGAGLELVVSIREPVPDAKIYYIFTAGSAPQLDLYRDLSAALLSVFSQPNTPVYLQCALGLPRGPNWRKVAPVLGFPIKSSVLTCPLPKRFSSPIPSYSTIQLPAGTSRVNFRGYHMWINSLEESGKLAIYHHLCDIPFRDLDPEVSIIATGEVEGKTFPLLTQRKNYFFVNGNFIHLNFSNVLCNLMAPSPVFYNLAGVYLTCGRDRSAVFSAADTAIDIALPHQGEIFQWHSNGAPYPETALKWHENRLQGYLKKWELAIVLASARENTTKESE